MDYLDSLSHTAPSLFKTYFLSAWDVWSSPLLWALFAGVFLWERLCPADPKQSVLSRGMVQDLLWFNFDIAVAALFMPVFAGLIHLFWDAVAGGARLDITQEWPFRVKVLVGILLADVLFFSKHWLSHKFVPFWHFHAVHHSQTEMNLFTDRRVHVLERMMGQIIVTFPLSLVGLSTHPMMLTVAFFNLHTLFIHSNIRTNLGWLGTFLVSPQYHRVHHSIERRHFDKNFGAFITLWDRALGTHYPGSDEYPPTGVKEVVFPPPRTWNPGAWLSDLGRQLWYPFGKYFRKG